jgi:Histidine kinase
MTWVIVHTGLAAIAASLLVVVLRERGVVRSALVGYLGIVTVFHMAGATASPSIWFAVAFLGPGLLNVLVETHRDPSPILRKLVQLLYIGSSVVLIPVADDGFQPAALYFLTVVPVMLFVLVSGLRQAKNERGLFAVSLVMVVMLAIYAIGTSHAMLMRAAMRNRTLDMLGESLPLAIAVTIAFYRYRFAFMDRFIPGAIAAAAVAVCVAAIARIDMPGHALITVPVVAIVVWNVVTRAVRALLFGRAPLESLPLDAQRVLAGAATEEAMIDSIRALLASRLRAEVTTGGDGDCQLQLRMFCFGVRPYQQPYLSGDVAILTAVVEQLAAAISALRIQQERAAALVREAELRELATRAELSAMRAQIQPHFLFNTLNTLAELVRSNPAAAEALVERLADVFRYALASSRTELVTLREEIEFVSAYLAVEEARFEERLRVSIDIPDECQSVRVPPMSLQPIVENAIRHRISRAPQGGSVTIRAKRGERVLRVEVRDESAAIEDDPSPRGSGVSLENVRRRLAHLLGTAARVELLAHGATGSTVTLQVPL